MQIDWLVSTQLESPSKRIIEQPRIYILYTYTFYIYIYILHELDSCLEEMYKTHAEVTINLKSLTHKEL